MDTEKDITLTLYILLNYKIWKYQNISEKGWLKCGNENGNLFEMMSNQSQIYDSWMQNVDKYLEMAQLFYLFKREI